MIHILISVDDTGAAQFGDSRRARALNMTRHSHRRAEPIASARTTPLAKAQTAQGEEIGRQTPTEQQRKNDQPMMEGKPRRECQRMRECGRHGGRPIRRLTSGAGIARATAQPSEGRANRIGTDDAPRQGTDRAGDKATTMLTKCRQWWTKCRQQREEIGKQTPTEQQRKNDQPMMEGKPRRECQRIRKCPRMDKPMRKCQRMRECQWFGSTHLGE
ncbi:hypothetical protein niasHS_010116 [Heterodera schachtii]|uniref:Uncharacterized protein n=1 Tax=Heterodera schachtii TaxID=97005 RepID=A0ABD2J0Z8_HETSC